MNLNVALFLVQDGLVSGAIYALLALAFVVVFAVTRVLFVPQGEFVTFGALSFAALQLGQVPGIVWLLGAGAVLVTIVDSIGAVRRNRRGDLPRILGVHLLLPALIVAVTVWLAPQKPPVLVQILLAVALVTPLGPITYRLAFQPVANASVLMLLIVGVAVHFALQGLGLVFFGAEGYRVASLFDAKLPIGPIAFSGQQIFVLATSLVFMLALYLFFGFTLLGKALRATAVHRVGARLVGIRTEYAGALAFTLAAFMGAISGVMIIGLTTLYYDSGFIIGLKGLVAAIFGGMLGYPMAIVGALIVGIVEAFGSFWASALKDMIVFLFLIPVLLLLSLRAHLIEEGEEDEE
ncbi:MAG: branched-chain amino acid ABC transporter permease [Alphaproteobacteria bacterium]